MSSDARLGGEADAPGGSQRPEEASHVDWSIRIGLSHLRQEWSSVNPAELLRGIFLWLDPKGEHPEEVITEVFNIAQGYQFALTNKQEEGRWSEHTPQLLSLADRARALAVDLENMSEGSRVLWLYVEQKLGIESAGDGLFPVLHPERMPQMADSAFVVGEGWLPRQPLDVRYEDPPSIAIPVRALADRLKRVTDWTRRNRAKVGRKTVHTLVFGSPELELFRDAKRGLVMLGLSHEHSYELGRRIHELVTGSAPSRLWGKEANERVESWFAKVDEWVGREAEAPKKMLDLIQAGPKHQPLRKPTRMR